MKKPGRPPLYGEKMVDHKVILPKYIWDEALRLGNGQYSEGLRMMLEKAGIIKKR